MEPKALEPFYGKIVDALLIPDGSSVRGRIFPQSSGVLMEQVWSLRPHRHEVAFRDIASVTEICDHGFAYLHGHVSPQACWEIFEHVLVKALSDPRCSVEYDTFRDDQVTIVNRRGHAAKLMFSCFPPPDESGMVTWEGDRSWVDLGRLTKRDAVEVVLCDDPADHPTIETKERVTVGDLLGYDSSNETVITKLSDETLAAIQNALATGAAFLEPNAVAKLQAIVRILRGETEPSRKPNDAVVMMNLEVCATRLRHVQDSYRAVLLECANNIMALDI